MAIFGTSILNNHQKERGFKAPKMLEDSGDQLNLLMGCIVR